MESARIQLPIQPSDESYRMAQRDFQCYGCDKKFRKMISVRGQMSQATEDINCPGCGSDFIEEARTAIQIPRAQPQPAPQPQPRSVQIQNEMPLGAQTHSNGWTQSVTVTTDAQGNTRTSINTQRAPSPPSFQSFGQPMGFGFQDNRAAHPMSAMQDLFAGNMLFNQPRMSAPMGMRFVNLADLFQRQPQEPETVGCKPEFINALPANQNDGDCYICLEKLEKAQGIELSCGHAFDKGCLAKWLEENHTCPVCRAKMPESALQ